MDFSNHFAVEIYGPNGWEVAAMKVSWDAAIEAAKELCSEYQVRITSPRKEPEW